MRTNALARIATTTVLVGTALLLLAASPGAAQAAKKPPAPPTASARPPAIDPDATAALGRLGKYLRTLTAFQVKAVTTAEDVLANGEKVERDDEVDLLVRSPNRLRAEVSSAQQHRMYFYDGKTFTVWAKRLNYFATVPAPQTITELVTVLQEKHDIELPLVDLFYWGTEKSRVRELTSAIAVGPSEVNGVTCEHYAFRQRGLDWQIWIQQGEYPLPLKLVLTTTTDAARPEYTATMTWNLAPSFNPATFVFVPEKESKKIMLSEARGLASTNGRDSR